MLLTYHGSIPAAVIATQLSMLSAFLDDTEDCIAGHAARRPADQFEHLLTITSDSDLPEVVVEGPQRDDIVRTQVHSPARPAMIDLPAMKV
ncbi:hypothetical protein [Devosia sp.]|uniref:hypothetical protein n=1 Tax=Devosia sp. TaxID=1871048 RepID=UPI0026176BC6|nr:hypothetical protein [Devosia sp.]